jgi:transcriptional regulator with XRE-family HTH domain
MTKQPREKTAETLGANVRYLREHASISQTELARRMTDRGWSWHQSTVYRVETGKQPVRFDEAVDLADLLGVTLDRLTWAIGEAAEEELATFAITSLRERMQEAAVAVARLRVARVVAERRAKSAADSEYPHIRELATGIEQDLQSVNLGAVLELASLLWRRYRQDVDTDPGDNAPIWDYLHSNTSLREALERINETYGDGEEDTLTPDNDAFDPADHDLTWEEDP